MLIIDQITIQYQSKEGIHSAVNNLSLQLEKGQALTILGPSGCGKSTLINALAGFIPIKEGKVEYIQDSLRKPLHPKTHKIGLIPQNYGLLPWKSIRENCLLALKIRKEKITPYFEKEMMEIFQSLGIEHTLEKYPKELSGGQVQRAAIARAFILKPDLLLMDEPFSALDAITKEEAQELFLQIWKQAKPTTILVTHSIEEALYLGNRILVMANGGLIRYSMDNPYFGVLHPKESSYYECLERLREELRPITTKEECHG